MRNFRAGLLYSVAILVSVAAGTGYIRDAAVFWFRIGLIFVLAGVATYTLPVSSRIFHHRRQPSVEEQSLGTRRALIATWRGMITDVHETRRARHNKKSVTELLEAHPTFPSLR
jgi:hypothetical protein